MLLEVARYEVKHIDRTLGRAECGLMLVDNGSPLGSRRCRLPRHGGWYQITGLLADPALIRAEIDRLLTQARASDPVTTRASDRVTRRKQLGFALAKAAASTSQALQREMGHRFALIRSPPGTAQTAARAHQVRPPPAPATVPKAHGWLMSASKIAAWHRSGSPSAGSSHRHARSRPRRSRRADSIRSGVSHPR